MDAAQYSRLQALFDAAVELKASDREAFVARADPGLRPHLQALLAEDDRGDTRAGPFAPGVAGLAARALDDIPEAFLAQTFGPYRLEGLIGQGGMGLVFRAVRDDLGSAAAIKVLRDAWLSPARQARFIAEQRALAELRHPSVASLYDADTLPGGTPWFAMELVDGVPITEFCTARNCDLAARLALFRSVCIAVQHAHRHAIIHRDVKPSNILVTAEGVVKLLDFGIAKHLDTEADATRTGVLLMTPAYAAPEQLRGEPTGIYTDVYSLGVLLFQLLTDKLPAGEKPSAHRFLPAGGAAWRDLDVLCLTAAHPDPLRRYASVEALVRDVDHFTRGQPLEARADRWSYRSAKFLRRNRAAVAAAASILVLLTGLMIFYTARLREASNAATAEAARAQRTMRFLLNLFEGGDQSTGPSNDLRVVSLLDTGETQTRALSRDPAAQSELYRTLGDVQRKLGRLDRAETLLQSALDTRRTLSGPTHPDYAESLLAMSLLRADQAQYDVAERLARDGLTVLRRAYPAGHPAIAEALEALGKVLEERGSFPAGIAVLEEALALRRASPATTPTELASAMGGLANLHFYAGNYKESQDLNQHVLAMHREIYGPAHPAVAGDLVNLGAIQQDLGNYAEAEKIHRQALAITKEFYGDDHPRTAAGLTLVARALVFQKRPAEALPLLLLALATREKVYGPVHPQVASTLNELGNVDVARNQFAAAERSFRRVVSIYRSVYAGKHYLISIALSNLASVFMAQKQFRRAEPLLREAMAMYALTLPPTHVNVAIGRIKLGRTLLRLRRFQDAEKETRAGYDILSRQANPAVSWLNNARADLAEEYAALGTPGKLPPTAR